MAENYADVTYCTSVRPRLSRYARYFGLNFRSLSGSNIGHPVGRVITRTCRNGDCWPEIGTYKNVGRATENVPDQEERNNVERLCKLYNWLQIRKFQL